MKTKTLTAILHKEEDMYVAECPEVGTVDQGETIKEALSNLKEATRLYLEECPLLDIDPDEMRYSDTNEDKLSCLIDSGNKRSSNLVV